MYPARRMMRLCALAGFLGFAAAGRGRPLASRSSRSSRAVSNIPARMLALTAECGTRHGCRRIPTSPTAARSNCSSRACRPSASTRSADPLFLIAGGPGTSAVDLYTSSAGAVRSRAPRSRHHSRWTSAAPAARIGSIATTATRICFERIDDVEVGPGQRQMPRRACRRNPDLRMYTTSVAVRDLDAGAAVARLRTHQSLRQLYGTRVAQHYARRYPKCHAHRDPRRRGESGSGARAGDRHRRGARARSASCSAARAMPHCAKAFTDPSADYRALRAQLTRQAGADHGQRRRHGPAHQFRLHARGICPPVLRFASYNDDQAALLPLSLHLATHEGNFTPLASQFRVFAHSLEAVVRLRHAQQRGLQRRRAARSMPRSSICAALNATHMGAEQVQQLDRSLQGLAEGRRRRGSARAVQE